MNHFGWNPDGRGYQSVQGGYYASSTRTPWNGGYPGMSYQYPYGPKKHCGPYTTNFTGHSTLPHVLRRSIPVPCQAPPSQEGAQDSAEKLISNTSSTLQSCGVSRPAVSSDVLDEMEYILSGISSSNVSKENSQSYPPHQGYNGRDSMQWKGEQTSSQSDQQSVRSSKIYISPAQESQFKPPVKSNDELSEIVNQVLNTVSSPSKSSPSKEEFSTKQQQTCVSPLLLPTSPMSGNLCHNCGSIVSKGLSNCQLCGESLEIEEPKSQSSGNRGMKPRTVGIVEPRIIVKAPHQDSSPPTLNQPQGEDNKQQPLSARAFQNRKRRHHDSHESEPIISRTPISSHQPPKKYLKDSSMDAYTVSKAEKMGRPPLDSDSEKIYQCPECGAKFLSMAKMLKHDRKVHAGVKNFECRLCEAEITDIVRHSKVHKQGNNVQCKDCDLTFRHRSSYVRHLSLHHIPKDDTSESISFLAPPKTEKPITITLDDDDGPTPDTDTPSSKPLSSPASLSEAGGCYKLDYSSPHPSSSDSGISSDFNSPLYSEPRSIPQPSPLDSFERPDFPNILAESLFEASESQNVSPRIPFEFNVDLFNDEAPSSSTKSTPSKEPPVDVSEEPLNKNEENVSMKEQTPSEKTKAPDRIDTPSDEIEIDKIQEAFQKELDSIATDSINGVEKNDLPHPSMKEGKEEKQVPAENNALKEERESNKDSNVEKPYPPPPTTKVSIKDPGISKVIIDVVEPLRDAQNSSSIIPPALKRKIVNEEYLKKVMSMLQEIEVTNRTPINHPLQRGGEETRKWKRRKVNLKEIEDNLKERVQSFIKQLKCIREDGQPQKEENFSCNKCGRVYKFENFFKVHKRRCE